MFQTGATVFPHFSVGLGGIGWGYNQKKPKFHGGFYDASLYLTHLIFDAY